MTRSETCDQVNVSPGCPVAAKPRKRVLKVHPSKVCRASWAKPVVGPAKTAPFQEVTPHIQQQVPKRERRANGERKTSSGFGDIVRRLITPNPRVSRNPGKTHPQTSRRGDQQESSNRVDNVGDTGVSKTVPNAYEGHLRVRKNSRVKQNWRVVRKSNTKSIVDKRHIKATARPPFSRVNWTIRENKSTRRVPEKARQVAWSPTSSGGLRIRNSVHYQTDLLGQPNINTRLAL